MQTVADFAEANGKFREVTFARTFDGDGIAVHTHEVVSHLKSHILRSYSENDVAGLLHKCQGGRLFRRGGFQVFSMALRVHLISPHSATRYGDVAMLRWLLMT